VVVASVAVEDDLRHLFQRDCAFIGTRSIPFNTKIWSNPKNLQIGTERLLSERNGTGSRKCQTEMPLPD
jgi:hypothetical protein